jgi:acetolactate synthase I/III small subunit
MQNMTNTTYATPKTRTGCSNAPQGTERVHTLVVLVADRPGSVDRVVGVLRRRRAQLQSFNLSQSETPEIVRITALVKDTEVGVEHLFEQIRKIVDVRQASHIPAQEAILREMALVNVSTISASADTIISTSQQFGASTVEITSESVTLQAVGTEEQITAFIEAMRIYSIRDVARSGCIALIQS